MGILRGFLNDIRNDKSGQNTDDGKRNDQPRFFENTDMDLHVDPQDAPADGWENGIA